MKAKNVCLILLGCSLFLGCGGGDDTTNTTIEDHRICTISDSFNNQPELSLTVTEQAEEAGLDVIETGLTETPLDDFVTDEGGNQVAAKAVSICGDAIDIDAIIASDEFPELADFLATGKRRLPLDSEE